MGDDPNVSTKKEQDQNGQNQILYEGEQKKVFGAVIMPNEVLKELDSNNRPASTNPSPRVTQQFPTTQQNGNRNEPLDYFFNMGRSGVQGQSTSSIISQGRGTSSTTPQGRGTSSTPPQGRRRLDPTLPPGIPLDANINLQEGSALPSGGGHGSSRGLGLYNFFQQGGSGSGSSIAGTGTTTTTPTTGSQREEVRTRNSSSRRRGGGGRGQERIRGNPERLTLPRSGRVRNGRYRQHGVQGAGLWSGIERA